MKARYLSGLLECFGGAEVYSGLHPGCIRILLVMLGEVARGQSCLILGAIAPGEGESCRPQLLRFLQKQNGVLHKKMKGRIPISNGSVVGAQAQVSCIFDSLFWNANPDKMKGVGV